MPEQGTNPPERFHLGRYLPKPLKTTPHSSKKIPASLHIPEFKEKITHHQQATAHAPGIQTGFSTTDRPEENRKIPTDLKLYRKVNYQHLFKYTDKRPPVESQVEDLLFKKSPWDLPWIIENLQEHMQEFRDDCKRHTNKELETVFVAFLRSQKPDRSTKHLFGHGDDNIEYVQVHYNKKTDMGLGSGGTFPMDTPAFLMKSSEQQKFASQFCEAMIPTWQGYLTGY